MSNYERGGYYWERDPFPPYLQLHQLKHYVSELYVMVETSRELLAIRKNEGNTFDVN